MGSEEDIIAKQVENFQDYDFLDFGCSQGASLRFGVNTLRGTRGIGFDIDPQKVEEANELLKMKKNSGRTYSNLSRRIKNKIHATDSTQIPIYDMHTLSRTPTGNKRSKTSDIQRNQTK